jgi:ribosome maturation factor RimP
MQTIQDTLTEVIDSVVQEYDLFMVDLEIKATGKQTLISVFLDTSEAGLNIDTCAKISREIAFLIESKALVEDKYTLNVSSPGLDRPLKDDRQYPKNIGRKSSVKHTSEQGNKVTKGVFKSFDATTVTIDTGKEGDVTISRDSITEFKILPAF